MVILGFTVSLHDRLWSLDPHIDSTVTLNKLDNTTLRYGSFLVVIEEDPKNQVMSHEFLFCHISPFAKLQPPFCLFFFHAISDRSSIQDPWNEWKDGGTLPRPATCSSKNFSLPFAVARWRQEGGGWICEFVWLRDGYYHKDQPNVGKYTIHGSYGKDLLGGGFNFFFMFTPENWGNDPILTIFFSNGLKSPTSYLVLLRGFSLSPIIVEVETGCFGKVTILLEIHPFFTEPWLYGRKGNLESKRWNVFIP